MSEQLIGRWGPYDPKTPEDKKKARIQAQKRRESQAMQQAWLDKHKRCANGCGKPVAFYTDSPSLSLKHGGCCSLERTMAKPTQPIQKSARVYLRVSTEAQDLERQEAIVLQAKASGYYVAGVYREKASGARADRPELLRMIADLQAGEVVIAERIDRISRLPLVDAEKLVHTIQAKGARLAVPGVLDLSEVATEAQGTAKIVLEAMQTMLLRMALQIAREEYETRRERQAQGIELAKSAGRYKGRKPNQAQHARIVALRLAGYSIQKTADMTETSTAQVKRVWAMHKKAAA
jgi:DNA invertase Pin-like site-specific DNA recombinase